MNTVEMAPAFEAARQGYDVWLGNFRGNKFSRAHVTLDPDTDMDYWKFSWAEMGKYDIPAMLGFIKQTTGSQRVAYVGHSMGTTAMFYLMSTDYARFREDVSIYIALAPVV